MPSDRVEQGDVKQRKSASSAAGTLRAGAAKTRVGLDVGAVSLKVAVVDDEGNPTHLLSRRHHGNPVKVATEELAKIGAGGRIAVGITGANSRLIAGGLSVKPVDFVQAEIRAVRSRFPGVRNIINVGGGSVTLIQLDEHGNFLDYTTNSLCAAGTGAFLDQQADRLGIRYDDLDSFPHDDDPPSIATRCSVFAKSDLIHRQQEGFSKSQLWCGLCKGMTSTFLNTLLRGRPLKGLTVVTGGVALNKEVMHWLKARYGDQIHTYDHAAYSGAVGAACLTNGSVDDVGHTISEMHDGGQVVSHAARRKPLKFAKTKYPSFDVAEAYVDSLGNEVRITRWPSQKVVSGYLGIDVGSTSTKLVLIDEEDHVLADVYRRTAGAPIDASKHLFTALLDLSKRKGCELKVLGSGTTGSGRKLVGRVVGADVVINEITAHLAGAMHFDPQVDTIFEIGGQDSKYVRAKDGRIYDSNMNYVCAAGTGSFVEEQAKKLGFKLEEIGDTVMGIAPPLTSDRCTVFMEQDVDRLIREGYSREECMAAVLYSVVQNYLNKVVGKRHYSKSKVFFQGATARNKGLVAAFENLLDVEMVVSPYCHVMGAVGTALLVKRRMHDSGAKPIFRGLDLSTRKISLASQTCELCQNRCKISFAEIEGETDRPSWGYMCGRDPESSKMRVNKEFAAFRKRLSLLMKNRSEEPKHAKGTIGVPLTLHAYSLLPLWRTFLQELGYKVEVSERTDDETIAQGAELTSGDFCFPVKIAHGHCAELLAHSGVDFLFLPHVISNEANPSTTKSYVCPFVEAFPSVLKSTLLLHDVDVQRVLSPIIDFTMPERGLIAGLVEKMGKPLGLTKREVTSAWRAARKAQEEYEAELQVEGRKALEEIEKENRRAIVILGRPYNTLDAGATLGLPQKIAELGMTVLPIDMLPYDIRKINPIFQNMYWHYGQHIICAAEFVRQHPNLFGIYFTNFGCGPDSFLLGFVEEVMGEKPTLTLELDEHGGDAGYLTRVEAFLDVIGSWKGKRLGPYELHVPEATHEEWKRRKVWVPGMHPMGAPLLASAMVGFGYDACALPDEDQVTLDIGKAHTRGSECLPAAATTGAILRALRENKGKPGEHALFMPTASGPCRFGQYCLMQRMVFNSLGLETIPFMSPSAENAYQGMTQRLRFQAWNSILASDILWKMRCKQLPYEKNPGEVRRVLAESLAQMQRCFEKKGNVERALRECVHRFMEVPVEKPGSKPLVGIVGEIYVRCNPFCNDYLTEAIERMGGEAWLAPLSEWMLYTAEMQAWVAKRGTFNIREKIDALAKNRFMLEREHRYYEIAKPLLHDRIEPTMKEVIEAGAAFVPVHFQGEAILTLGRAEIFCKNGAQLVVNAAPFGCMPGTITSALARQIQTETDVPIVSMFYDGKAGQNERLEVFFNNLCRNG